MHCLTVGTPLTRPPETKLVSQSPALGMGGSSAAASGEQKPASAVVIASHLKVMRAPPDYKAEPLARECVLFAAPGRGLGQIPRTSIFHRVSSHKEGRPRLFV